MTKVITLQQTKNDLPQLMQVLNRLMTKTNINIYQLSKNTGLANTTVKRMCADPDCNPTLTSIKKIADFFDISPNQLIGAEPLPGETATSYFTNFNKWRRAPILSLAQLLNWPHNIKNITQAVDTQYVMTDIEINQDGFAVIAKDETLEPKFSAGTILIFSSTKAPQNKDYVVLLSKDKELPQFRQILIDGPDMYATTINPEFREGSPVALIKNQFKILGVLVQAKSNYI